MKILYQDLINHLSEKPSKELLSEKLFQLGHEHEIYDDIFDMEITPNRGDCLSLLGLARELNIFFDRSSDIDIFENNFDVLEINFQNLSPLDCPKISFLEIEIEEIKNGYKPYLENYFSALGNKKTNLFTDISNYISYELGQPTHCFDRETIKDKLLFENKKCNNTFKTLLGSEITLKDRNCVFTIDGKIISLAGVMGGMSTACSLKTKKVLIECAYFSPESIIGKSLKYNLTSDAAHKFERGVDFGSQEKVLRRFAKIVSDHATVKTMKFKSFTAKKLQDIFIPIDIHKINKVLGIDLDEFEYLNYLQKLGFVADNRIKVPSYRSDIKTQNDLAEEIARVIGYNKIKSTPIKLKKIFEKRDENRTQIIESLLCKNGFSEVINFPFTSSKEKESIKIDNSLDSTKDHLRISIKDSLIKNLLYNERRQKDSMKLFEISNVYSKHPEIKQRKKLGIIISGRLGNNFKEFSAKLDYKYLDQLLNRDSKDNTFEINEISRDGLDTKKKDKIFYAEVFVDDIPDSFFSNLVKDKKIVNFITYKPISDFPSSTRDFSFSITNLEIVDKVIKLLSDVSDEIIKDSFIFDFYKNNKTAAVKIGFRLIFQSNNKTLADEEINLKAKEVINPVLELDGVSIPGM